MVRGNVLPAKPIASLLLCVGLASSMGAPPTLEAILDALKKNDSRVHVVEMRGESHRFEWDAAASSWRITPETSSFHVVVENKPKGRYVLAYAPSIVKWKQGAAPYLAHWSTEVRRADGVTTYWLKTIQHHDGTHLLPVRIDEDRVSQRGEPANSARWMEPWPSVFAYSGLRALRPFTSLSGEELGRWIDAMVQDGNLSLSITEDPTGTVHVAYSTSEVQQTDDVVLDPKKGFALVRHAKTDKFQRTMINQVLEHRQIAEGIWFPVRFAQTIQRPKQDENNRSEIALSEVKLLDGPEAEKALNVDVQALIRRDRATTMTAEVKNSRAAEAAAVLQMPEGKARDTAVMNFAQQWAAQDPVAASEWVLQIPEGQARDWAAAVVAVSWAAKDPNAAANWVLKVPVSEKTRAEILKAVHAMPTK